MLHSSKHNLSSHEPADALVTRGTVQTSLVSPELANVRDILQDEVVVDRDGSRGVYFVESNGSGQLAEEVVVLLPGSRRNVSKAL